MPSTSRPLSRPSQVGVLAISVVHCVSASTNTRSKNSSSGVTRSPSRITALTCGTRAGRERAVLTFTSSHLETLTRGRPGRAWRRLANRPAPPLADQRSATAGATTCSARPLSCDLSRRSCRSLREEFIFPSSSLKRDLPENTRRTIRGRCATNANRCAHYVNPPPPLSPFPDGPGGGLSPQLLEPVERTRLRREYVYDHVHVVHQDPPRPA